MRIHLLEGLLYGLVQIELFSPIVCCLGIILYTQHINAYEHLHTCRLKQCITHTPCLLAFILSTCCWNFVLHLFFFFFLAERNSYSYVRNIEKVPHINLISTLCFIRNICNSCRVFSGLENLDKLRNSVVLPMKWVRELLHRLAIRIFKYKRSITSYF